MFSKIPLVIDSRHAQAAGGSRTYDEPVIFFGSTFHVLAFGLRPADPAWHMTRSLTAKPVSCRRWWSVVLGPRQVDVVSAYNTERYRPMYANKLGMPVFLNRAS
jgi:hypothetical protein